jgi:hypothetical protein
MDEVIVDHCAVRISREDYFTGFDWFMGCVNAGISFIVWILAVFMGSLIAADVVLVLIEGRLTLAGGECLLRGFWLVMFIITGLRAFNEALDAFPIRPGEVVIRQWEHDQIIFAEYATQ